MNPFQNNRPPLPPPRYRHHNLPPPPFLSQFPPPPPPVPTATQKVTLFVKNLPPISKEEITQYFMILGALEVRLMDSKKMKNSGFIDFQSLQLAEAAINYLNNNLWFGLRVKASLSKSNINNSDNNSSDKNLIEQSTTNKLLQSDKFNSKLATTSSDDLARFEPISKKLGINYPSNPELRYKYPDPTVQTLRNITKAIASVPRLYTQVLHLMNKMNLPPPFENDEFPELSNINTQDIQIPDDIIAQGSKNAASNDSSEEESEIEVEEDEEAATRVPPPKRLKTWAIEKNQ